MLLADSGCQSGRNQAKIAKWIKFLWLANQAYASNQRIELCVRGNK